MIDEEEYMSDVVCFLQVSDDLEDGVGLVGAGRYYE